MARLPPFDPPYIPGKPPLPKGRKGNVIGVSPGLITSTGGLTGATGALLVPTVLANGLIYLSILDPTNFNTEEACFYNFPQIDVKGGYDVTNHNIICTYRNLGVFTITFSVTVFRKGLANYSGHTVSKLLGAYKTVNKVMTLGSLAADNLLYTTEVNIINSGQRPQLQISRLANSGPMSITYIKMIGNASEEAKL